MKRMDKQAAQGDVFFTRIDVLPPGMKLEKCKPEDNGQHIVTHSETGHHHVMVAEHVDMFKSANDEFVMYLVVNKTTPIEHLRKEDQHETIEFPPGVYRVNKQREFRDQRSQFALD